MWQRPAVRSQPPRAHCERVVRGACSRQPSPARAGRETGSGALPILFPPQRSHGWRSEGASPLDVVVFGKHAEVDPKLRALTKEKLERITKYASDVRRIDVDYAEHKTRKAGDSHTCEILVHVNHHLVKGTAAATEHELALDK